MRFRRATTADAPSAHDLVQRAYGHYVERMGRRPGPMDDDYAVHAEAGELCLAEEDGALVGLLVLVDRPDHLLLANIAVDPARQGAGLGRKLMERVEAVARERRRPEIRLYTHRLMTENIAIYEHLGYSVTSRHDEEGFGRVFLAKPIG